MLDECHSITGTQFYNVLHDIKYENGVSVIGFSATPLRPRGDKQLRTIFCESDDAKKEDNDRLVNIISVYNLLHALKDDIVLPYKFHLLKLGKEDRKNRELITKMIFNKFNEVRKTLPYNKIICWAYTINSMEYWANKFIGKYGHEYKIFISSSRDEEYRDELDCNGNKFNCNVDEFYNLDNNAILIAVNRFREGSDIPNVDCAIYLDPIQKRSTLVAMQTSGRIIRFGKDDKKTHGTIIDIVVTDGNKTIDILTIRKIMEYGLEILNLSTPNEITDREEKDNDFRKIVELEEHIEIDENERKIIIKVDDDKKHNTEFIIEELDMDWGNIKQKLKEETCKKYDIELEKRFLHNIEYLKRKYKFHEKNIDYSKRYRELLKRDDNLEKDFLGDEFSEIWKHYSWFRWMVTTIGPFGAPTGLPQAPLQSTRAGVIGGDPWSARSIVQSRDS
jgi:superfamily II DNA or RNA helicase